MASHPAENGPRGFWRRQWRAMRFPVLLLCGFAVSMGTGFLAVRVLAGGLERSAAPDSVRIEQGERVRVLLEELATLADALGGRAHRDGGSRSPEVARWLAQELRPRVNYFRLQLADPHVAGNLPESLRSAFHDAAGLLAEAAARPDNTDKRAEALAAARRTAHAAESWIQSAGVGPYLRTPARFPHY